MSSWHSYPKIFALGHAAISELFNGDVLIEEKVDGSQFSFGIFDGEIKMKSKGAVIYLDAPEKMFQKAVEAVMRKSEILENGWTYRAEYLAKPKHNSLAYDRMPKDNLIVFDINTNEEKYLYYADKFHECERIGLECVPLLKDGIFSSAEELEKLLETQSVLGGQKIEGFVVKNYKKYGTDKKVLMGKYVSEAFKEVHKKEWKSANPSRGDFLELLCTQYRSESRWNKSIQHLRDAGKLEDSPRDIGNLIKEAQKDIKAECEDEIKTALFDWAWPKISRSAIRGLPEHYKKKLMEKQFE